LIISSIGFKIMMINVFLEHGHEKTFKFGQESSISSKTTHHSMKL
jgi:hypothetical protein